MEKQARSSASPTAAAPKPRRRLKPEIAARRVRAVDDRLSSLYEKPLEQLTPLEIQMMKQAFFRAH